jgi:hypothetical protein
VQFSEVGAVNVTGVQVSTDAGAAINGPTVMVAAATLIDKVTELAGAPLVASETVTVAV